MIKHNSELTIPKPRTHRTSITLRGVRKPYVPGVRKPVSLPEDKIELPPPEPQPQPPQKTNWLTAILPPIVIMTGMGIMMLVNPNTSIMLIIPSIIMSITFPLVNVIGQVVSKREYEKQLLQREQKCKKALENQRNRLARLAQKQRSILETESPSTKKTLDIAMAKGGKNRLWWRRPQDRDYLALRIGRGRGAASFEVVVPSQIDIFDPLKPLYETLVKEVEQVENLPMLIDLKSAGSLAIRGSDPSAVDGATRRLLLDLCVHHSPQDVHLALLTDIEAPKTRWGWLKWLPHTRALNANEKIRHVAFRAATITECIDWLLDEYKQRISSNRPEQSQEFLSNAIVAIIEDSGKIRQNQALAPLVENGYKVGIYLIFIGDRFLPRVRAILEVSTQQVFSYTEVWRERSHYRGQMESVTLDELELVARALAHLELMGEKNSIALPEKVRLFEVMEVSDLTPEKITTNWNLLRSDRELLRFPIGVCIGREGLEILEINLLPAERGGDDAYHTILIGTTGSGKSEFMKSVVLAAAYKYSPRYINFFFMDFKGGAAFQPFENIPHTTGIVTNLSPELVERGLDAVASEINRRQAQFSRAGVQNIWSYNIARSSQPLPHLVLFLDEFAKGLVEFPGLKQILELLVRQGRSLGMYLILANQDVNSAVESLLNNVGWRIALKVARPEEMQIIDKSLQPTRRAGHGFLRSLIGDITEFQSGYAGVRIQGQASTDVQDFSIYEIEADGFQKALYKSSSQKPVASTGALALAPTEEEVLIRTIEKCAQLGAIEKARQIYLQPLPAKISLRELFRNSNIPMAFDNEIWQPGQKTAELELAHWLSVPIGFLDYPQETLQEPLIVPFQEQDGHLWIIGSPGSGKGLTLETLLTSLALRYTPEEVNLYLVECGSSLPHIAEKLPHTGAFIRLNEQERLERLLDFLDGILDDPNHSPMMLPHRFVIVDNFMEMRTEQLELAERFARFVRLGKSAGIHLILVTQRGAELPRSISTNIANRIVLQMADYNEYIDILTQKPPVLSGRAEGRGYWASSGRVAECQIAKADLIPSPSQPSQLMSIDLEALFENMKISWHGMLPFEIRQMPERVNLSSVLPKLTSNVTQIPIPIGIEYQSLQPFILNLLDEQPYWLILGPRGRGKSNFLATIARGILFTNTPNIELAIATLRKSPPLQKIQGAPQVSWIGSVDLMKQYVDNTTLRFQSNNTSDNVVRQVLLIDDLESFYDVGREVAKSAFEALMMKARDRDDFYLFAAASFDDLRPHWSNPAIKFLKGNHRGLAFPGTDLTTLSDWFGIPFQETRKYRKLSFPIGRGIFVSSGTPKIIQTFLAE